MVLPNNDKIDDKRVRTQGITISDLDACQEKFKKLGHEFEDAVFVFNYTLYRWEVYLGQKNSVCLASSEDGWA